MSKIEERVDALESAVRDVLAKDEIRELTGEYCRQVVRGDAEALVGLFTDDATLASHFPEGSGQDDVVLTGTAALRKSYSNVGAMGVKPFVHNHIIEVDGDTARGFCSFELRLTQDRVAMTSAGHYEDEYRKVDGRWRFQCRNLFIYHWVPHTQGWA